MRETGTPRRDQPLSRDLRDLDRRESGGRHTGHPAGRPTGAPAVPPARWLTSAHNAARPAIGRTSAGPERSRRRTGAPGPYTNGAFAAVERAAYARRITGLPPLPAAAGTTPHDIDQATTARVPALRPPASAKVPAVSPAIRRMTEAPTDKHFALPSGTMVIPAIGVPPARRPGRARWAGISGGIAVLLALIIAFTLMRFSGPAGPGHPPLDGLAAEAGGAPGGAGAAAIGGPPAWQASAGAVEVLGAGGAAAPGLIAPGTAGAPITAGAPTASAPTRAPAAAPKAARPAPTATPRPAATATPRPAATATPRPKPTPTSAPRPTPTSGIRPAPVSPWPPTNEWIRVPGYTPYAVADPPNDPYAKAFGQCTWYAQYRRPDENLRGMGNAMYWATHARARGYRVGSAPAVGATVVFQPGVQGASGVGHVAHVLILYPGGWFLMAEMNAYGNGGGWGRVSFRYAHAGSGVSFIY